MSALRGTDLTTTHRKGVTVPYFPTEGDKGFIAITDSMHLAVTVVSNRCSIPGHVYIELGTTNTVVIIHAADIIFQKA